MLIFSRTINIIGTAKIFRKLSSNDQVLYGLKHYNIEMKVKDVVDLAEMLLHKFLVNVCDKLVVLL